MRIERLLFVFLVACSGGDSLIVNDDGVSSGGVEIASVEPGNGSILGGTEVVIRGRRLGGGDITVTFGDSAASNIVVTSDGSLRVLLPPSAVSGTVPVRVANGSGFAERTAGFDYNPSPTITAINPADGPRVGGTTVTITGTGFADAGENFVLFGDRHGSVTVDSDTQLTVVTPPGEPIKTVDVILENDNGLSTLDQAFAYTANGLYAVSANVEACRPGRDRDGGLFFIDLDFLDITLVGHSDSGYVRLASDNQGGLVGIETCTNDLHQLDPRTGEATLLTTTSVDFNVSRHIRGGFLQTGGQYMIRNPVNAAQIAFVSADNGLVTPVGGNLLVDFRGGFVEVGGQFFAGAIVTTANGNRAGFQRFDPSTGNVIGTGVQAGVNDIRAATVHRGQVYVIARDFAIINGQLQPAARIATVDPNTGATDFIGFFPIYFKDIASGDLQ